jgi:hypothetical protein
VEAFYVSLLILAALVAASSAGFVVCRLYRGRR